MKITSFVLVLLFANGLPFMLSAQSIVLDTAYVPASSPDGQWNATIVFPNQPNGVGVVVLHGLNSNRQTMRLWSDSLAANGYVAMAIDFPANPLSNQTTYPRVPRLAKTAIEFLRRNAARFGITGGRVAGLGRSGGALVLGQCITWDNDDAFFGTDSTVNDRLNAAVLLYGLYDFDNFTTSNLPISIFAGLYFQNNAALRDKGTAIRHVRNVTTPVLMPHGTADLTLQWQQSQAFHDTLVARGKSSQLILYPNAPHVFETSGNGFSPLGLQTKDSVIAFLRRSVPRLNASPEAVRKPALFALEQNYPNPFNPSTGIRYQVSGTSDVRLEVFDVLGRKVSTLVSERQAAGRYAVNFNAAGLASGLYFYKLDVRSQAGAFSETRKMMLLK
jgi:dienelactone hydrolase